MILNRLGNKTKIATDIEQNFCDHTIYIELFFGAGGMFFNKTRKAKYNFLNDLDNDVYNLFRQVIDNKEEFVKCLSMTPITEKQFKEWGKGQREQSEMMNAIRFVILSNFGLYGKVDTLRIGAVNPKKQIIEVIDQTFEYIKDCYFFNCDFRKVFNKCDYKSNKDKVQVYADPPYLGTTNNYSDGFTEEDSFDLFETLMAAEVK